MTARRRDRRQGRVRVVIALVLGAVVVLLATAAAVFTYGHSQLDPPDAGSTATVTVAVAPNETMAQLTAALQHDHLIRSSFWFSLYAGYRGLQAHLQVGLFSLDGSMGASEIVSRLEGPPTTPTVTVTFPEGLSAQQMADQIQMTAGLHITAAAYIQQAEHGSFSEPFLRDLPTGSPLEGFLFPDTYYVPTTETAHQLINLQLQAFEVKAVPQLQSMALSPYQTVIVASILEKEARFPQDLAEVSGVIANRLKAGDDLQLDSTVLYGLGIVRQTTPLTAVQLQQDTPYNTYLNPGLPPTPISNPGTAVLTAASHPAVNDDLFFITDCSGHVHLSVTFAQQQQAIDEYLSQPCPQ